MNLTNIAKRINEFEDRCISRGGYTNTMEAWDLLDAVRALTMDGATAEEVEVAREMYQCHDIAVDDDAMASRGEDGVWVEAWVFLPGDRR